MAPKRKQAVASTSSDRRTPAHSFLNQSAKEYFRDYMITNKKIICEVQFQPSKSDGNLTAILQQRKWQSLALLGGDTNVTIVREFYANLKASHKDDEPVTVRGKCIDFSAEAINKKLGLHDRPNDEFQKMLADGPKYDTIIQEMAHKHSSWVYSKKNHETPCHLVISYLNRYAQALCRFIRGNLMPTSQKTELTRERVVLLYCILTRKTVDVGRIIHRNIAEYCRDSNKAAHIHPVLITHLCAAANIPMNSSNDVWLQQAVYGSRNIAKIANWPYGTTRMDGLGFIEHDDIAEIPPPPMRLARIRGSMVDETHLKALQDRADARVRQLYETSLPIPHTHDAALPIPQTHDGASSSAAPIANVYSNQELGQLLEHQGQMLQNLTIQQGQMMKNMEDYQLRIERQQVQSQHQIQFMLDHQLAIAHWFDRYVNTMNNIYERTELANQPVQPLPDFPSALMQPYKPPTEQGDDGEHQGTSRGM